MSDLADESWFSSQGSGYSFAAAKNKVHGPVAPESTRLQPLLPPALHTTQTPLSARVQLTFPCRRIRRPYAR